MMTRDANSICSSGWGKYDSTKDRCAAESIMRYICTRMSCRRASEKKRKQQPLCRAHDRVDYSTHSHPRIPQIKDDPRLTTDKVLPAGQRREQLGGWGSEGVTCPPRGSPGET